MKLVLVSLVLLVEAIWCAPPIEPDPAPTETVKEESTTIFPVDDKDEPVRILTSETIEAAAEKDVTKAVTTLPPLQHTTPTLPNLQHTTPTLPTLQYTTPQLSAKEREALISHLTVYDLSNVDPLVLTPRQQQAIVQELEHKKLGLAPFQDPTPWQRLTRNQQEEFINKYLALRSDLQKYSRNQFLSLSEERQEHAYNAFLSVDLQTLSAAIERELIREKESLQQKLSEEQRVKELQKIVEQQSIAEEQRFVEQQRLLEQQRRIEQEKLIEQQSLKVQQSLIEQQQLEKQQRLMKEKRLAEQKIVKELEETKVEQKRQQEIQQLFETPQSQQQGWIEFKEQPRNQDGNRLTASQEKNELQFQHFKPVNKFFEQKQQAVTPSKSLISTSLKETNNSFQFSAYPSLREQQREQKRLNIRRLMFDPRRKQ